MPYTAKEIRECNHKFREVYGALTGHSRIIVKFCNNCPAVEVDQRVDSYLLAGGDLNGEPKNYSTILVPYIRDLKQD